ncbi:hypothetical protein NLJ89_g11999 [Agrocybe chaxingu]|uniref:Uncharacterized protein n=1 Tax=Agrocybe chaxingu TaxID=84603 RepID=A0A9W8JNZ3_9AGAR|nr:hypothetical protein NLJ89_g11999 [Agrocybe chaxingu]
MQKAQNQYQPEQVEHELKYLEEHKNVKAMACWALNLGQIEEEEMEEMEALSQSCFRLRDENKDKEDEDWLLNDQDLDLFLPSEAPCSCADYYGRDSDGCIRHHHYDQYQPQPDLDHELRFLEEDRENAPEDWALELFEDMELKDMEGQGA